MILSKYCLRDSLPLFFFLAPYDGYVSNALKSPKIVFPRMSTAQLPRAGDVERTCSQPPGPPARASLTKQPLPSANWGLESRPEEGGWGR